MIFERTKYGEVMALARLLNVLEVRLLADAAQYQPCIKSLEEINDHTYEMLINDLVRFARMKADGEVEDFDEMLYGGEEGEDEFDLERELDRCETYYEERMLRHWYNADDRYDDEIAMRIAYEDERGN